jgi:hypothetical protein
MADPLPCTNRRSAAQRRWRERVRSCRAVYPVELDAGDLQFLVEEVHYLDEAEAGDKAAVGEAVRRLLKDAQVDRSNTRRAIGRGYGFGMTARSPIPLRPSIDAVRDMALTTFVRAATLSPRKTDRLCQRLLGSKLINCAAGARQS